MSAQALNRAFTVQKKLLIAMISCIIAYHYLSLVVMLSFITLRITCNYRLLDYYTLIVKLLVIVYH